MDWLNLSIKCFEFWIVHCLTFLFHKKNDWTTDISIPFSRNALWTCNMNMLLTLHAIFLKHENIWDSWGLNLELFIYMNVFHDKKSTTQGSDPFFQNYAGVVQNQVPFWVRMAQSMSIPQSQDLGGQTWNWLFTSCFHAIWWHLNNFPKKTGQTI